MNYVGSVNVLVNGRFLTVPVTKVMYQNSDDSRPAGGVVEEPDGSMQIIVDARLPEADAHRCIEEAMTEISKRIARKASN